jgi:glycosyltransferase involved in cell wall biosynthesis
MRVWLQHVGERLPVDGIARCYRYGYLAQALVEQGHQVVRWAPTFSHIDKEYRFTNDCQVEIQRDYSIKFVHAPSYRRNIGPARLRSYQVLGRRLTALMAQESPPDIIVAAIPSLEWAAAAVDFGRAHGVPVVVDIRDPWPDVFLNALPHAARFMGRFALRPYRRIAERICRQADALVGVSQGYLDWALALAGRTQQPQDVVVPIGFEPDPLSSEQLQSKVALLHARGIDPQLPTCLFSGSFERSYDLETLIDAAHRLSDDGQSDIQFILCGDGAKRAALERRARQLRIRNMHFLGWVDGAMLQAAASISHIGICAYASDATQGLPNKPFEYMAGRLAVVSSLRGELANFLRTHRCGVNYDANSASSLASAIRRLVLDPPQLESLRDAGYSAWRRNYRSQCIYSQFVDHLASLTSNARCAA